jgi:hypothetical protein
VLTLIMFFRLLLFLAQAKRYTVTAIVLFLVAKGQIKPLLLLA